MNTSPLFFKSLQPSNYERTNAPSWQESIDLFKDKKYKESFYTFLDYLSPTIRNGRKDNELTIPHGSIIVHVKLDDIGIEVSSNVVEITDETLIVPLMRSLCEISISKFTLTNVTLEDEKVRFHSSIPYEVASPQKLWDIFNDICRINDRYTADYIHDFKAKMGDQPIVEQYAQDVLDRAWDNMQSILNNSLEKLQEYEKDRRYGLVFTTLGTTITSLEFYLQPQGYLKNLFDNRIWHFYDYDIDYDFRVREAKSFLLELKEMPKEEVIKYLYQTKECTPIRWTKNLEKIKSNWLKSFERIKESMAKENFEYATMDILNCIYCLLSYNNIPDSIALPIYSTLERSSGEIWEKSAAILYDEMCSIMIEGYNRKENSTKGFIKRLFKLKK